MAPASPSTTSTRESRTYEFEETFSCPNTTPVERQARQLQLIEEGIDPYYRSPICSHLLDLTARLGSPALCRAMVKHGVPIDQRFDKEDYTMLHIAARSGKLDNCLALLELGANPNLGDKEGRSPLFYTTDAVIQKLLSKHGADRHACDNQGLSLLHFGMFARNIEAYKAIVEYGIDINARTHAGQTVMDMAALHHDRSNAYARFQPDLIKLLIDRGANLYARTGGLSSFDQVGLFSAQQTTFAGAMKQWLKRYKTAYAEFQDTAQPPKNTTDLCHLLAATPLANPDGAVDQQAHLRQIFSHAKWEPGQAAEMAQALHKKHIVTATFAEELAAIGEPHKTRRLDISGRAR